jgi:hypothetical protein
MARTMADLYREIADLHQTIERLERKIAGGPLRKWIETDDPEVIKCMGAIPACAARGCQGNRIVKLEKLLNEALSPVDPKTPYTP